MKFGFVHRAYHCAQDVLNMSLILMKPCNVTPVTPGYTVNALIYHMRNMLGCLALMRDSVVVFAGKHLNPTCLNLNLEMTMIEYLGIG